MEETEPYLGKPLSDGRDKISAPGQPPICWGGGRRGGGRCYAANDLEETSKYIGNFQSSGETEDMHTLIKYAI
jgi:hypothetical protein